MTDFNATEVYEALVNTGSDGDRFEWGWYAKWDGATKTSSPLVIELRGEEYEVQEVHSTGGENEGSRASTTISVGTQFFRKTGFYASFDGYDWDGDFDEVFPVSRNVVFYETPRETERKPAPAALPEGQGMAADAGCRASVLAVLEELRSTIAEDMGERDVAPALSRIRVQIDALAGVLQTILKD
jgi:hypothetical protein